MNQVGSNFNPTLFKLQKPVQVQGPALQQPKTNVESAQQNLDSSFQLSEQSLELLNKAKQGGVETEKPVQEKRQPSGEMAEMLENLQKAEERYEQFGGNTQKLIQAENRNQGLGILSDFSEQTTPQPEYSSNIDGALAKLLQQSPQIVHGTKGTEESSHEHGHGHHKEEHGKLGMHLGLEAGEHGVHSFSHAADIKAAVTHAAEVKTTAAEVQSAIVDAKSTVVHGKTLAVETKSAALQVKTTALDAKNAAIEGKQTLMGEISSHGSHAAEGVDATVSATSTGDHAAQLAEHGTSTAVTVATGAIGGLSGVLGFFLLKSGWKQLKEGKKNHNLEQKIEGGNSMLVGTRSVAASVVAASHVIHGSEILTTAASIAKSTLTPLGVVHGAIDAGLGVKDVVQGVKTHDTGKVRKGALGIGLGASLIAAAAGAGIPAIVAASVFLVGKVANGIHESKKNHQAQLAQQQATATPQDQQSVATH